MAARVIGIGQRAAGDDGVGLAVLDHLRQQGVPEGVELCEIAEATALIPMLATPLPVIVVDAVLATSAPGDVVALPPEALSAHGVTPVSTHGVGLIHAIELARILSPEQISPSITIVGIGIERPDRYAMGLSAHATGALPRAARVVLALAGESRA